MSGDQGGPQKPSRRAVLEVFGAGAVAVAAGCSSDGPGGAPAASATSAATASAGDTAAATGSSASTGGAGSAAASASTGGSTAAGAGGMTKGAHATVAALTLSPADRAAATTAGKGAAIGVVAPVSAEYLANVAAGAKAGASQFGMRTQVADYQFDAAKGVSAIENFVSQGIKYLIVVLTDPVAMIGAVKAAIAAGVTVVQFAGQQVADQAGGYSVSISDADLGVAEGQVAAAVAKPLGKIDVAVLDFPSQPNVIVRADNMVSTLKKLAPDVRVVARVPGGTETAGLTASESLLQKYPKLRGILSINDAAAYGAVQAFQGAGRTGATAFVTGTDAESKAKQLIAAGGIFKATVDTQPFLTGQAAAEVIGQLLAGKKVAQYTTVPVKALTR